MENILLKNRVTRADWNTALDTPDAPIQLKIMDYGFCEFNIGDIDNVKWLGRTAPGTEGYRCAHEFAQCFYADTAYRAPEVILQLREVAGARITVASDLFSFGCVLYEHLVRAIFHESHMPMQVCFGLWTACFQMQRGRLP
jgi:serine/threonine protein kinase